MCKSVRGAAFFGSSIHLALSFIFLCWFVFDTLISEININLWKCDPPTQLQFRDIDPLSHYLNIVFKLFYFVALFVTGIYMFRGVERERPQILKFATLGFVILQIVGIVLFSIFFTIQWNTEPQPSAIASPEAARQTSEVNLANNVSVAITKNENSNNEEETITKLAPFDITEAGNTVTPMISENVLPAPDINDTTTTTTPIPIGVVQVETTTSTTTTSPVTITTSSSAKDSMPCSSPDCSLSPRPPPARQRLPHNQLVSLVLQMCFAVANGIGSVVYVIVLALYMLKL